LRLVYCSYKAPDCFAVPSRKTSEGVKGGVAFGAFGQVLFRAVEGVREQCRDAPRACSLCGVRACGCEPRRKGRHGTGFEADDTLDGSLDTLLACMTSTHRLVSHPFIAFQVRVQVGCAPVAPLPPCRRLFRCHLSFPGRDFQQATARSQDPFFQRSLLLHISE
jgi:hypothetical protein